MNLGGAVSASGRGPLPEGPCDQQPKMKTPYAFKRGMIARQVTHDAFILRGSNKYNAAENQRTEYQTKPMTSGPMKLD